MEQVGREEMTNHWRVGLEHGTYESQRTFVLREVKDADGARL